MRKKGVQKSSSKDKNDHLLQFQFNHKQNNLPNAQFKVENTIQKQLISSSQKIQQVNPQILQKSQSLHENTNTVSMNNIKKIKKKKITKNEENEAILILKQKQTQRLFQHLCNPEGFITVQSLGRVMVRAKKQFEMQDLQNMIAYYETVKKNLQVNQNENELLKKSPEVINRVQKVELLSQAEQDENSYQNFEYDFGDQQNAEEQERTQLNLEEFRLIKKYFDG